MNPFCAEQTLSSMSTTKTISTTSFRQAGERSQVIDVRTPAEFDAGHLPGAVNIPMETIESRLADIDFEAPTVLVCQSGTRAGVVCGNVGHRFADVAVLEGGTKAWIADGGEVVRTTRSGLSLMSQSLIGAGLFNLVGIALAMLIHPAWIGVSVFVSLGLTVAGTTGFCLMAIILGKMPWNRKPVSGSEMACGRA